MVENSCVLELFGRIIDSRYYQKMRIHLLAESTLFLLDKAAVSNIDTRTAVGVILLPCEPVPGDAKLQFIININLHSLFVVQ